MSDTINSFDISTIPTGLAGTDVIAAINQSIGQINAALNQLYGNIIQTSANSAVIRKNVPISVDCVPGCLVYFNADENHSRFEPAYAVTLGEPGNQGQTLEAPSSRVEGMILSVDDSPEAGAVNPTVHATMLCGGYYEDADAMTYCLGANRDIAGTYYLTPSSSAPGTAVDAETIEGHLRQPVLSNYGGGKFSLALFYLAHDNHFHGSYEISAGSWVPVGTELPPGVTTPPTGAYLWYEAPADDIAYVNMKELSPRTTAVFYNGALQGESSDFVVDQGYLWYKQQTSPAAHSVVIFNHYPFAYDSAVVRSVESMNDTVTVTNRNGLIQLTANDFASGGTVRNAYAVSAIVGRDVMLTPVVSGVAAGPGMSVNLSMDGVATISSADYVGYPIDAQIVNYNGAAPSSDGRFIYFTFPKGRTASGMIVSAPINGIPNTTTTRAYLWVASASSAGFDVKFYWVQQPDATAQAVLPTDPTVTTTLNVSANQGAINYAESGDYVDITGSGMLSAVINIQGTPSDDIRLLRIGFRLEVVNAATATAQEQVGTGVNSVINTAVTAGSLAQYTCVKVNASGKLEACQASSTASCNACVGVLLDAATGADAEVRYMLQGVIISSAFQFTPGAALYIGANGAITAADPSADASSAFIQRIGTVLASNIIQIGIQPGVLKE